MTSFFDVSPTAYLLFREKNNEKVPNDDLELRVANVGGKSGGLEKLVLTFFCCFIVLEICMNNF